MDFIVQPRVPVSCCDAECCVDTIVSNSYLYKLETEMPECQYILQISSCASEAIESFSRIKNCNIKYRNPDRALTKCSITFQCSPKSFISNTCFSAAIHVNIVVENFHGNFRKNGETCSKFAAKHQNV